MIIIIVVVVVIILLSGKYAVAGLFRSHSSRSLCNGLP
jgi:hypothetical protein